MLWAPSACAAFVLVFFPAATQIRYGHRVGNFRVPLPWSWTILKEYGDGTRADIIETLMTDDGVGRFGINPFWTSNPSFSEAWFATRTSPRTHQERQDERTRDAAGPISTRDVALRDLTVTCWEFLRSWPLYPPLSGNYVIECEAAGVTRYQDFEAGFVGRQQDISDFYVVLQQMRAVY